MKRSARAFLTTMLEDKIEDLVADAMSASRPARMGITEEDVRQVLREVATRESGEVLLLHKRDGNIIARFKSPKECAQALRYSTDNVVQACTKKSLMAGNCFVRFARDWNGVEVYRENMRHTPVIAQKGSVCRWFPSRKVASGFFGMEQPSLSDHIRSGNPFEGWNIRNAHSTLEWDQLRQKMMGEHHGKVEEASRHRQ